MRSATINYSMAATDNLWLHEGWWNFKPQEALWDFYWDHAVRGDRFGFIPGSNYVVETRLTDLDQTRKMTLTVSGLDLEKNYETYTITFNLTIVGLDLLPKPVTGTSAANTLKGGSGFDTIKALGGNDKLYGNAGGDKLYGGDGNDRIEGGTGDDRLYGQNGNDTLLGGDGHDYLSGGAGNDRLDGGKGYNYLLGGAGADIFDIKASGSFNGIVGGPSGDIDKAIVAKGINTTISWDMDKNDLLYILGKSYTFAALDKLDTNHDDIVTFANGAGFKVVVQYDDPYP